MRLLYLVYFFMSFDVGANPDWLSQERRTEWQPGFEQPLIYPKTVANVRSLGAKGDGRVDDTQSFEKGIKQLSKSGGVLLIPKGQYRLTKPLVISRPIILKGFGSEHTKLVFEIKRRTDQIAALTFAQYNRGQWVPIFKKHRKGSSILRVKTSSFFKAGDFVEISQQNDPKVMYTQAKWNVPWARYSVGQILKITKVEGDQIFLNKKLYMNYEKRLKPRIRRLGMLVHAGVQDLSLRLGNIDAIRKQNPSEAMFSTLLFKNVAHCLVKGIESEMTYSAHVTLHTAYGCEITGSYFHHSHSYAGNGNGYGVAVNFHSTDNLIENSMFSVLRHAMLVQTGSSGNVFGYNFSNKPTLPPGETSWKPADISLHGHYPNYNLFESNVINEIAVSDWWGPSGPGNTFLRNVINGETIFVMRFSHGQNVIGNIVRTKHRVWIAKGIRDTLMHGNREKGLVRWDKQIKNRVIPKSFYLDQKPDFWGTSKWPAQGPDVWIQSKLLAQKRVRK